MSFGRALLGPAAALAVLVAFYWRTSRGVDGEESFVEATARHGYASERHTVLTEDGYALTLFRMGAGARCAGRRRPPVLLMHGLLQSSDSWLDAGPGAGLAYLLADACFDAWAGNARGNSYSRGHRRWNPDADAEFWEFSTDEFGYYDVPATIDYVLEATGEPRLGYVGFSQGGDGAYVMMSERPEYCERVGALIALAAPTRLKHITSSFKFMLEFFVRFERPLRKLGVHEYLSKSSPIRRFAEFVCPYPVFRDTLCRAFFETHDTVHPGSVEAATFETLYRHFPAGTSTRTMVRYGQVRRAGRFQKYDFGAEANVAKYGAARPPEYDLRRAAAPTLVVHGAGDTFVGARDARWVAARLPRLLELFVVEDPLWNHYDMTYSRHANVSLFPKIDETLRKYLL